MRGWTRTSIHLPAAGGQPPLPIGLHRTTDGVEVSTKVDGGWAYTVVAEVGRHALWPNKLYARPAR